MYIQVLIYDNHLQTLIYDNLKGYSDFAIQTTLLSPLNLNAVNLSHPVFLNLGAFHQNMALVYVGHFFKFGECRFYIMT
jgi:hypothetical protein